MTRAELENEWSLADLAAAHDVIEMLDEAENEGMTRARQKAESQRRSP